MRGKILFVSGAAVGFVLGARAGRERYDQLKAAAVKVWESPSVQRQVHTAQDYVADKVGELPETVYITVKKLIVRANDRRRETRAPYSPPPVASAKGRSNTPS